MKKTYNKHEKLKRKKEIELLFNNGKWVSAYPLRLVYLKNTSKTKVGVSVSKKNIKRAVDRIRVKRLLREAYRLNKPINNNMVSYSFMIIYQNKTIPNYKLIETKIKKLFASFLAKEKILNNEK